MKKILLHVCCAPCLLAPLKALREKSKDIYGLFFNPNIHPLSEYIKRREALDKTSKLLNFNYFEAGDYSYIEFLRNVAYREFNRCNHCYYTRLHFTAHIAKKSKYHAFSSTLLYSKFQKHSLILDIAKEIEEELQIPFYYEDWRVFWKWGIEESKRLGIYRQEYCGCIFSEYERYKSKL